MEQKIIIPDGFELKQINEFEYKIVKKEKELVSSWEEFCEKYLIKKEEYYIGGNSEVSSCGRITRRQDRDKNVLPNREKAEAILALCQLIQLRDCYNDGWKPDWENNRTYKYCIEFCANDLIKTDSINTNRVFAFKTEVLRDKFFENFNDLLEKVKPLYY